MLNLVDGSDSDRNASIVTDDIS